ncbi:hypothetical protein WKW79_25120 [Variovorax robiniae]|uniref:Tetratricopeptide repeat protein n=1 Tax=Variovorax robiniae TaxID=1836199 RepID=A0ABU8XDH5_9BURK
MRKLLASVSSRLGDFIAQRDDVALVLSATEADALPLLTMLDGIEAERGADFFWTFTDAFVDGVSYAEAIHNAFAAKHGAVRLLMEKEGMTPWPPMPAVVESADTVPALRLRELAKFCRALLPVPDGALAVLSFFPLKIDDGLAYANLMSEVIAHRFPLPWCHHLRFILRDDPAAPELSNALGGAPRVQHFAPDLSVQALSQSIEDEAADETLPLPERMSSLLVSAGNDLAFGRHPMALEKYALLFRYHGAMNSYAMAALAMLGMGQVYERMGETSMANDAYQAALIPASQGSYPSIQVLLNVVLSLANLRTEHQQWDEAEGYWDVTQQLAVLSRDGPLKARALLQRGYAQEQQGKLAEAEQSWFAGTVIAAQLEETDLCGDCLERLRGVYVAQGQDDKALAIDPYLAALGRDAGTPEPAGDHDHGHG